jgi:hypothetical protein
MLMRTQPPELQGQLAAGLVELMAGVQPSLDAAPRDKFTQNLSTFKAGVAKSLRRPDL